VGFPVVALSVEYVNKRAATSIVGRGDAVANLSGHLELVLCNRSGILIGGAEILHDLFDFRPQVDQPRLEMEVALSQYRFCLRPIALIAIKQGQRRRDGSIPRIGVRLADSFGLKLARIAELGRDLRVSLSSLDNCVRLGFGNLSPQGLNVRP